MNKHTRILASSLVFLVSIAAPSISHADWKGTIEVQGAGGQVADGQKGQIFAQGHKIRFEMQAQGHDMIVLADAKGGTAAMLMPQQKMAMEMPASMSDKKMMTCSTDDVEGCLKSKGFKKTGNETVDGHPCAIYEADEVHGQTKSHQKLWRPTDMKEVFMIKSLSHMDDRDVTTTIKNIKFGKLEDALFKVPADYKKMQMPDLSAMHH